MKKSRFSKVVSSVRWCLISIIFVALLLSAAGSFSQTESYPDKKAARVAAEDSQCECETCGDENARPMVALHRVRSMPW